MGVVWSVGAKRGGGLSAVWSGFGAAEENRGSKEGDVKPKRMRRFRLVDSPAPSRGVLALFLDGTIGGR